MTATELAELMFEEIYKHHGVPRNIISDRDVLFTSVFWQRLHSLLGTKLKMSSAYHPQTDGSTERANRTVTQMLRQCVNDKQTDWARKLPGIEFAINSARSESTGYTPFFLNYGRLPRAMIWNSAPKDEFPAVRNFALQKKLALMQAHDSILATRVKQTRDANRRRRMAPFEVGDLVYISTKNISFPKGLARKLIPKYIGPYKIIADFKNFSFKVELPASLKARGVHDVFHSSLLRVHKANNDRLFPGRLDSQITPVDDGPVESEWSVDRILSHSGTGRNAMFEVKWRAGDITWLPHDQLDGLEPLRAYLEALDIGNIDNLPMGAGKPLGNDPEAHLGAISFEIGDSDSGGTSTYHINSEFRSDPPTLHPMTLPLFKRSKLPNFKRHQNTRNNSNSSPATPNFLRHSSSEQCQLPSINHPAFKRLTNDLYSISYPDSDRPPEPLILQAGQVYLICTVDGLIRRGVRPEVLPLGYDTVARIVNDYAPTDFPFRLATIDYEGKVDVRGGPFHIALFHLDPTTYGKPEPKLDSIDNDAELLPVINHAIREAGRQVLVGGRGLGMFSSLLRGGGRGRGRGARGRAAYAPRSFHQTPQSYHQADSPSNNHKRRRSEDYDNLRHEESGAGNNSSSYSGGKDLLSRMGAGSEVDDGTAMSPGDDTIPYPDDDAVSIHSGR
ncbi:hypothetical protein EST38_g6418 [Candolleomyces aberdarensis]|uniref:Integrase catalytic domain-containing protein n=1 Tax=Candolleomyces aberdarensis TaxID=2316362 RepID=A0A4Q2DHV6_9AGAR|nr:hypothetical protein EST38_g6418 [Candolleomyces aberdarensis]